MKVVNVDSIDYHLIDGGYYADKDDIDELDSIEMYTKDEVIAMFVELQQEIEKEFNPFRGIYSRGYNTALFGVNTKIKEKIKKMRGGEGEKGE